MDQRRLFEQASGLQTEEHVVSKGVKPGRAERKEPVLEWKQMLDWERYRRARAQPIALDGDE